MRSICSCALLEALNSIEKRVFSGRELYTRVAQVVGGKAEQLPDYKTLEDSGHIAGDIIFVRAPASAPRDAQPAPQGSPE